MNYDSSMSENKGGRPPKDERKRKKAWTFSATTEEWELLERAAKRSGQPVRAWILETLLNRARRILRK